MPRVSLVGAGPGAPDLLTVRAVRVLASADCVLYDRLVAPEILALLPPATPREFAGKVRGHGGSEQPWINARLVTLARRHGHVVRLKGGDPLMFGRGGEELLALTAAGIPCDIVPGITAAAGCAAAAGIPLTHRGLAAQVTYVTAQRAQGEAAPDWAQLAVIRQTLVIYMGVAGIADIESGLLAGGRDPGTPVALIENGCTPRQRIFHGRLGGLTALAAQVRLCAPALLVIGEVSARGFAAPTVLSRARSGVAA
jgi:uroporphyrin-III C-methyltransferase